MRKLLLGTAAAIGLAISAGTAQAAVVNVLVWNGPGGGTSVSAGVQAGPTNPLITPADLVAAFTYSGSLNFNAPTNTIASFFASGGGTLSNFTAGSAAALNTTMSTATFATTTVIELLGSSATAISGSITHDDGIFVDQGGVNDAPGGTAPTTPEATAFNITPGNVDIFYVATNNLPEVLNAAALNLLALPVPPPVPEPASLALLGSGLAGLGMFIRRRRKNR